VHGQHELQGHLLHGQHEHWVKLLHGTLVQGRVKVVSQKQGRRRVDHTWGDEDAGDAGESADHHGLEEDPAPAPLVHHVPAQKVGRHLHGRAAGQQIM